MVYRYFGKGTSKEFTDYRQQLVKEAFTPGIESDQQGAIIQKFRNDFTLYSLPVLDDIDNGFQGAERKLQAAMVIPMTAVCSLATALSTGSTFKFHLEPVVSSTPIEQISVLDIVELTVVRPSAKEEHQKMVALVELKHGNFPSVTSQPFSQLIHAAALAYNSRKWQNSLLCCVGSLTDWHLFVINACLDISGQHFAIAQYHHHSQHLPFNASLVDFYSNLVKKLSHAIVRLAKNTVL